MGIAAVQCLEGDAVWEAAATGRWSMALAEAACDCIENKPDGGMVANTPQPAAFLIEYRDGFNATVLMLEGYVKSQACETLAVDSTIHNILYGMHDADCAQSNI